MRACVYVHAHECISACVRTWHREVCTLRHVTQSLMQLQAKKPFPEAALMQGYHMTALVYIIYTDNHSLASSFTTQQ